MTGNGARRETGTRTRTQLKRHAWDREHAREREKERAHALETVAGQLLALIAYNLPLLALQMSRPQTANGNRWTFNWPIERGREGERERDRELLSGCSYWSTLAAAACQSVFNVGQPRVSATQMPTHIHTLGLHWPKPIQINLHFFVWELLFQRLKWSHK